MKTNNFREEFHDYQKRFILIVVVSKLGIRRN